MKRGATIPAARVNELEDRLATKVGVLLDEGLDPKTVAQMSKQWNEELETARGYLAECQRLDAAASHKQEHMDTRYAKAKLAFRMLDPSPEEQKRLYELLDVKAQVTSEGTLIVSGELGLAVEVFANGEANPDTLLREMLAMSSRRSSSPSRAAGADPRGSPERR